MGASRKFRNVTANPNVALVIDDIASYQPWKVRCVEIRGHAEALTDQTPPIPGFSAEIIGIHPDRILSFGLDDAPPDRTANVAAGNGSARSLSASGQQPTGRQRLNGAPALPPLDRAQLADGMTAVLTDTDEPAWNRRLALAANVQAMPSSSSSVIRWASAWHPARTDLSEIIAVAWIPSRA